MTTTDHLNTAGHETVAVIEPSTIVGRSVLVNLTDAEFDALWDIADELGKSIPEILHELIVQTITQGDTNDANP